MKTIEYKDLLPQIRNRVFNFYNFYNLDIDPELFYGIQYYNDANEDVSIPQKLKSVFLDIEVYRQDKTIEFKVDESLHPISAITFYFEKVYHAYFLNIYNIEIDIKEWENEFKNVLVEKQYIPESENVKIKVFNNELDLLTVLWQHIKDIDPCILSGWYSDYFDYPYIYRRLLVLLNNDETQANSIISRFNYVKFKKDKIIIPEYNICDLMYLYKPRDDGGRNYGRKQTSYSLNYISDTELKLQKFEYKSKNIDLDQFYENDPKNYLLYNVIDVVLCVRLNDKLRHIELHNDIRRIMKCTFDKSLIGSSAIFDSFVIAKLNKKIRYGITTQVNKTLPEDYLKHLPTLRTEGKRGQLLTPISIAAVDYSKCVSRFDGAYVTKPIPAIRNKGVSFSLDATSMYPSMMLQFNISFDVYRARVISSTVYKLLTLLSTTLGKTNTIPNELVISIFDLINKYISNKENKVTQKEKTRKVFYFIIIFILSRLYENGTPLINLLKPSNDKEQILLSLYLIHLLDLVNLIHTNHESYNDIIYSYLFDTPDIFIKKFPEIYIINNPNSSHETIIKLPNKQAIEFLSQYVITITGTCFTKHDEQLGLFTNMLEDFSARRKEFQKEMEKHPKGSELYQLYNARQNSIKIVMNSNYGVQGLRSFRFSNSHLAHSITTQGKLTIKLAQYVTDKYLEQQNY